MRARTAYISSFGTTSILVAASLLMLGLVSAIVGFHGFPGSSRGEGVTSVPLAPPTRDLRVARHVTRDALGRTASSRVRARAAGRRRGSARGVVKLPSMHPSATVGVVKITPGAPAGGAPQGPVATPPAKAPAAPAPPSTGLPLPPPPDATSIVGGLVGDPPPPPVSGPIEVGINVGGTQISLVGPGD